VVTPEDTTGESAILPFFKYNLIPNGEFYKVELIYESRTLNGREITNAFYSAGPDTLPVGRRVLGHKDIIDFESPEPVELTINVTDELGGTATFTHTINPIIEQQRPNLQIDSIEFNPNEVVFFSNLIFDPYNQLEGIERYNIDFGDGTSQEIDGPWFQINHQYPNTGLYNATLTAFGRNGASFSHNQEIEVVGSRASYELPIADFRVEQGDAFPGVRLYVDQSISPNAPIKQFLWNLGDDTTAYGSEVIHFYDAGAYDVTLTAILEDGSSSVVKREAIIMRDAPNMIGVVDCFDEGDLKTICDFSALDRFGELSEVKIHFGDSEINDSTINSAPTSGNYQEFAFEHQYQNAGTYRVVYQVLSSRGEVLDGETEVTVSEGNGNQPPIADLACYTSFNSIDCHAFASIDYDGFITNYKFTFGNGDSFETVDPQAFYTYPENGVYEITLEVTDNLGATSSASQVVTIEEKPNEFPVPQLVCDSNNVQELTCNASSSYDSDGSIVGARITFLEDGEAFESSDFLSLNPTKSFSTGGVKSVKLEIEDDQGALVEVVRDFEPKENQAPIASFVCLSDVKNTINCDARSSQDDESITSYEWNIAGSIYYGETLSLSNVETQELEVSLTVKDRFNATESKAKIFQIQQNLPPYGSFVCESTFPFNLICTADFKDSDGSITSYAWLIDGESYIGEAIELNLSSGGLKEILIYVEDDSNAVTTSKRNIFVQDNAPPVAKITVDEEVKLSPAQFNIKATGSYDPDDNAITYKWELPSGEIKTGEEISFNTSEDGEFNIKLTVADPFTTTTINKKVTATSLVNNDIIAEGDRGTIPTNISLEPKELQDPLGNALSFKWYINGDLYSESVNPSLSIENIEDKNVLLITEDIFGNYTSASTVLTFEKPPLYFSLEQDFYTLDANQETRIRLQSLNTTDNQLQVLTSSTLDLVSNHDDGDLTVKGATAGIGLLTIEATSGDRSFTRTVEIEILAPAEPKQLTLTADQLPLSIDGETYAYLSGAEGSQVEVRATKNSQGDVRIYLNGALDSEAVVIKPAQENGYDIKLSNPQISSFTGTEIAAIFGGIYSDTIYLHDDGLAATVKICPYPFGYTVKKFLAATPTIDIQKRTDTTTPSAEYLPTFSIGNQKIQVHRKVVTDYFNISVNNQTQQLRYIPNFEAANMKKLLAIFENDEFDIGAPLRIHAQDIFEPNAAAHVIEGVQAIYINHSWLQELAINSHKLLFILAHERAHLRQNSISCKTIRKMKSLQDYEVVKESMANARAFKVLLEFIDEPYVEKDLLTFNTHRSNVSEKNEGKAGGINEELKSLLNIGINNNITTQADTYTNGYHLDLLEESLTEYIERRIPDDHYSNPLLDELDFLNTYHPQSLPASFKDKAVGYLDYLFENKALLKLGFDEAKASHSIEEAESNDLTVGPYGFGVVRIPSSVIKQNSVNDQEFRIEIAGTAFQNLELSTTGNSYNEFESIKQIEIEGDNRIILSIKIQQSNKDGYLFLTNSHEESHTGALVKDYTGICLDNELPFNNKCVICLERYGGAIDTSSGECRYPGPIESKWTGRNVSDHKEACNKWYAGETGGQSPGLQKVTKTFSYLCAGDDAIEKHIQVAYGEYTCRYQFYSDGTYEFVNKYSAYEDTQTSVTANCHQSQTIFEVPSVL
jgi:PKD repeat protein